ncbi:MAG: M28 family peptidase [Polyangiaceae bacterium]
MTQPKTEPNTQPKAPWARRLARSTARIVAVVAVVVAALGGWLWYDMLRMPGSSFSGELPPLSDAERARATRLERDVKHLATGPRILRDRPRMKATADWIADELAATGLVVERHAFDVDGDVAVNVTGTLTGTTEEIVLLGAHYDTAEHAPGANDNGSGVASLLALARSFAGKRFRRTIRFVAFTNEEPPYFQGEHMGSLVHAARCRERGDAILAMLSLETMGYYSDEPDSQNYPPPFSWLYPSTGNFIAFVGNRGARDLVRAAVGTFRASVAFPSEGAAPPALVQGVGWSDQWSFWQQGYPNAIMVTDTAPFRYVHYHETSDTPDKLDYERLSRVLTGLEAVVGALADDPHPL